MVPFLNNFIIIKSVDYKLNDVVLFASKQGLEIIDYVTIEHTCTSSSEPGLKVNN